MSIQPQEHPGGQSFDAQPAAQPEPPPSSPPPLDDWLTETCPGCGAPVQPGQVVCAECGAVLHGRPPQIRCRHCGQKASSAYALCPHCGRELAAAPSPWLIWGIPAGLLLALALIVLIRTSGSPVGWVKQRMGSALTVVENPVLTPVRGESESSVTTNSGQPPRVQTPVEVNGADNGPVAFVALTDTPIPHQPRADTPTSTNTAQPTATPTASPMPTQTATSRPSATSTSTASATPTSTPNATATRTRQSVAGSTRTTTPPPAVSPTVTNRTYAVQSGDTAFSIANHFQITTAELLRINQLTPADALRLTPGMILEIPGRAPTVSRPPTATATRTATKRATATPIPTATPTAAIRATLPGQQVYTVVSGDTFVGIALRFNISTEALLAANGWAIDQARDLRPGQKLIIPAVGQPLPPTATPTPGLRRYTVRAGDTIIGIAARNGIPSSLLLAVNGMTAAQAPSIRPGDELLIPPPGYVAPTDTPRPAVAPTATPTPLVAIRLPAPGQIDPAQDINVPCRDNQFVRWKPLTGLAPGDEYVLFLGYVNSAPDAEGNVKVEPLLQQRTGQSTSWQMDASYCNLAPQAFGRRWRWYVQVFNGDAPVSPPSETWEFTWR